VKERMSTYFETDRIIFRDWQESDREHFARMNSDPVIMEYMPHPLNEKQSDKLVEHFQTHFDKHGFGLYALERKEDGAFMGFTGLQNVPFKAAFTPATEIAWRLDYEYWGQGYASEAAQAVLAHGFDALGLAEIVAFCVHDNTRSIGVMKKIGLNQVEDGEFRYPGLSNDHPLGSFVLYRSGR